MREEETATVGETVRHPLWPELGTGRVLDITHTPHWTTRNARISWSTGQRSSHALSILRVVNHDRPRPHACGC